MQTKNLNSCSTWTKVARIGYDLLLMAAIFAGEALAKPGGGHGGGHGHGHGVPELDPGSIAGALTLLVGGLLIIRDRRRQK